MKTFIVHIDKRRRVARVHQTDCPDLEKRSQDSLTEYFLRNLSARAEGAALGAAGGNRVEHCEGCA